MAQKPDLNNFCKSNGFCLKEYPLEGRLLVVLLNQSIIIKKDLRWERKELLVSSAISYLFNYPDCRLAIFLEGQKQFFPL